MVEKHGAHAFEGKVATVDLSTEVQMIREIRAAIGDDPLLRIDANYGWDLGTASEACRRFSPYNVANVEDPVASYDELRRLRDRTDMSFSTHNPDLLRAIHFGVPDYIVSNLVDLGGIRRTVQFAEACALTGVGFWFHSGDTGVATAGYLHVSAAVNGICKPHQSLLRWTTADVIEGGPFQPQGGLVAVPEGPGLGVELNRDALSRLHHDFLEQGPFPGHILARVTLV
jgi:glucarate dehydratase